MNFPAKTKSWVVLFPSLRPIRDQLMVPGNCLCLAGIIWLSAFWAAPAMAESFKPPPQSISDITAILLEERPDDPKHLKSKLSFADRKPPKTLVRTKLAQFYLKRGRAARRVGRVQQTIEDLTRAHRYADKLPRKSRRRILQLLALAELAGGHRERGIEHMFQAIEVAENQRYQIELSAQLAGFLLRDGRLNEAEKLLSDADRALEQLRKANDRKSRRLWSLYSDSILGRLAYINGNKHNFVGQHSQAESFLRRAIEHYSRFYRKTDSLKRERLRKSLRTASRTLRNHARGELGIALLEQGRILEAEVVIREALLNSLSQRGKNDRRTAKFASYLGRVKLAQGRPEDAKPLLTAVLRIQRRIGLTDDSAQSLNARQIFASLLFTLGKWEESLQQFEYLKTAVGTDTVLWSNRLAINPTYAAALLMTGRVSDALYLSRQAVERHMRLRGKTHKLLARARGVLAMTLMILGQDRKSLEEFAQTVPSIVEAGKLSGFGFAKRAQDNLSRIILESYLELLARIRGTALAHEAGIDATNEGFVVADILRGQIVQRALNASAARIAGRKAGLADLVRQFQDSGNEISALNAQYAELLMRPTHEQDSGTRDTLTKSIAGLKRKQISLLTVIEQNFPEYAALMSPSPLSIAKARDMLRGGENLIATYIGDTRSYVWAIPKSGPIEFQNLPIGKRKISVLVERVRRGVEPANMTLDGVPAFDVSASYQLYSILLAPVIKSWKGTSSLIVVPHGPLKQLPFSLMATQDTAVVDGADPLFSGYRKVPWLVRTHAVTSIPTVSSLESLRRPSTKGLHERNFVAFADPRFTKEQVASSNEQLSTEENPTLVSRGLKLQMRSLGDGLTGLLATLPPLPDTAEEVRSVGAVLKADASRDLYIGVRANEFEVKNADLEKYRVIAFASHTLLPGELDGLTQPAIAMSAPEVAGISGDGLLTADEVLELRLNASWVVLSACNTAAGGGQESEAVAGLGWAFIYAGARTLLVSHWAVESSSAKLLVTDLFRNLGENRTLSRSAALRRAMLKLMDKEGYKDTNGHYLFSYAHPLFWAPFSILGEGGST